VIGGTLDEVVSSMAKKREKMADSQGIKGETKWSRSQDTKMLLRVMNEVGKGTPLIKKRQRGS